MGKRPHMRSGDLNRRLTIQSRTATRDATGGFSETWADTGTTVWASIRPLRGDEQYDADQQKGRVSHRITMLHGSSITETDRLQTEDDARTFDLVSVRNVDEANVVTEIDAIEQTKGA